MDFLLELLFEAIGEVFLENGVEIAADRRLPKWARILILTVSALVFAAVFGVILAEGVGALSHTPLISLVCFVLDAALVVLLACQLRGVLRTRSHQ